MPGLDLLLVRPPARTRRLPSLLPPLGLQYVAGAARAAGFRVGLIDAPAEDLTLSALRARCRAARPGVIGLGGFSPVFEETVDACRGLAGVADRMVIGGAHATRHADEVLETLPEVDTVVVGEAENTVGEMLSWFEAGARGAPPAGLRVRGQPLRRRPREHRLDRLARPARDLVDPGRYRYPLATRPGVATLMTGRGCPGECVFCDKTISGSRPRFHGAERVVDELRELADDPRVGYAVLFDDDFVADRERVEAICEGILGAGIQLPWKCEARVDAVDASLLATMYRAGCRLVAMGVESRHARSLERLRKGVSPGQIREAFAAARRVGVDTLAYVLVGIPGESAEDALATADFCCDIGARWVQFATLSPFPGTAIHREAVANGWLVHSEVRNPADAERRRPTLVAPPWTEETLRKVLWRAHARFYLRPGFAAELARGGMSGVNVGPLWHAGRGVAGWMAREGWRIAVSRNRAV